MIAVIDYGVGNLFSLCSSLKYLNIDSVVTRDKNIIEKADKIILPGVGAFGDASNKLKETGMFDFLQEQAATGKPFLGICLGMQLLFEKGFEYGEHEGLGLIKGKVIPIESVLKEPLKIPQMGWNKLDIVKKDALLKYTNQDDYVYFVHSYFATDCAESISSTTEYGATITASVSNNNVFGAQFHPEKSGAVGLNMLKAFNEI
ncbi:MAG: imidazole glycerol phosphate synthase subunit HisH [Clostridia bacterium]|nr:imidazole glycerol phosphate synthase subunit HisH [Clostridia bacterium]